MEPENKTSGLAHDNMALPVVGSSNRETEGTFGDVAAGPTGAGLGSWFAHHPRRWQDFHYVYPVVSRRSGGLSIGVNLNVDKACNFDCIYCCVDRTVAPVRTDVDLGQLRGELERMIELARSGAIWSEPPFTAVPQRLRRINDIAFSGDGEPTADESFEAACRVAVEVKDAFGLGDVKIVVITNATLLDRPSVERGLALLDHHEGEIWAKLDAGTEDYYRLVDRTHFPFQKVLDNILACGRRRPVVIQSLFMKVHGQSPGDGEFESYLDRLKDLLDRGCRIQLVQVYTTARRTAETFVGPLEDAELDRMGQRLRDRLPSLSCEVYHGV